MRLKGDIINLILSILSLVSLTTALLLNYFRTELFGVVKGYAPHNFSFNITYFFPLSIISILTSLVSLIWLKNKWKHRQNKTVKWITLSMSLPAICFLILMTINVFLILRVD